MSPCILTKAIFAFLPFEHGSEGKNETEKKSRGRAQEARREIKCFVSEIGGREIERAF